MRDRHRIIGHTGYRLRHLADSVRLAATGRLHARGSISAVLPLEAVHEGIRRLREHAGNPIRVLLRP